MNGVRSRSHVFLPLLTLIALMLLLPRSAVAQSNFEGTVTGAGGAALDSVTVSAYLNCTDSVGEAVTDGSGWYQLFLDPGVYCIMFTPVSGDPPQPGEYAIEWYGDKWEQNLATRVNLGVDESKSNIDARLEQYGAIAGTVTSDYGELEGEVTVEIYRGIGTAPITTVTMSAGPYDYATSGLAAGSTYRVRFVAPTGWVSQWYSAKADRPASDQVNVAWGLTTRGIDARLVLVDKPATISGVVSAAGGGSLTGPVSITAYRDCGTEPTATISVDEVEGYSYSLSNLPAGIYCVWFQYWGDGGFAPEWHENKRAKEIADLVSVAAGEVRVVNAALEHFGLISGVVSSDAGMLNGVVYVSVYADGNPYELKSVTTNADSGYAYTIGELPASASYKIHFSPENPLWMEQWYRDRNSREEADPIAVAWGAAVTGVDARLGLAENSATLTGTVTAASGGGLVGQVAVIAYKDCGSQWTAMSTIGANDNYVYSLSRLPAGNYCISFEHLGDGNYATEWYNNKRSRETADMIQLARGEVRTVNVALERFGAIAGTIAADFDSVPLRVRVEVYGSGAEPVASLDTPVATPPLEYTLAGIPPGSYKVRFLAPSGVTSPWYNAKSSREAADPVTVQEGLTASGINALLSLVETTVRIKGTVTAADGEALTGPVNVSAFQDCGSAATGSTTVNETGGYTYTLAELPAGEYCLFFDYLGTQSLLSEWHDNKRSKWTADLVSVAQGEEITVNAALDRGLPDLKIELLQKPPETVRAGQSFFVTDKVTNAGDARASASKIRYYLSGTKRSRTKDVPLSPLREVPSLQALDDSRDSLEVTVPMSIPPGNYRLIAVADALRQVNESSEINNVAKSVQPIVVRKPTSDTLIDRALAQKKIGKETALLYKVFADFGDKRLPAKYRGDDEGLGDSHVLDGGWATVEGLSPRTQSKILPFFIPPFYQESWYQGVTALPVPNAAPAGASIAKEGQCLKGIKTGWKYHETTDKKARVWWDDNDIWSVRDEIAARFMVKELEATIWPKLTALMGEPKLGLSQSPYKDCSGLSRAIDISLVDLDKNLHGRAYHWSIPGTGNIDITRTLGGGIGSPYSQGAEKKLRSVLAHEFMHILQFKYWHKDVTSSRWWWEATAKWAEEYVYHNDNLEHNYFDKNRIDLPLWEFGYDRDLKHYQAYFWPWFLAGGEGESASVIPDIFARLGDVVVLHAIDEVIAGGFARQWPICAAYYWNAEPVDKFQEWDGLTKGKHQEVKAEPLSLNGEPARKKEIKGSLKGLTARYFRYTFSGDIRRVSFRWDRPTDFNPIGIQVFYRLANGTGKGPFEWNEMNSLCRDHPSEDAQELVLVVANYNTQEEPVSFDGIFLELGDQSQGCNWPERFECTSSGRESENVLDFRSSFMTTWNKTTSFVLDNVSYTDIEGNEHTYVNYRASGVYGTRNSSGYRTWDCTDDNGTAGRGRENYICQESCNETEGGISIGYNARKKLANWLVDLGFNCEATTARGDWTACGKTGSHEICATADSDFYGLNWSTFADTRSETLPLGSFSMTQSRVKEGEPIGVTFTGERTLTCIPSY